MSERRKDLRPREKLQAKGPQALSDLELLMAIIGSGSSSADVGKLAREVRKVIQGKGSDTAYDDLVAIKGLGSAKATLIIASRELWLRQSNMFDAPVIDSPAKAVELLADIRDKRQEYFVCITLDGANRLIEKRTITIGTLTASLVHPREVYADAIADRAASIIVTHNHPSGNLQPSDADRAVTERLREAGELLGISLTDHIIVTKVSFASII